MNKRRFWYIFDLLTRKFLIFEEIAVVNVTTPCYTEMQARVIRGQRYVSVSVQYPCFAQKNIGFKCS